MPQKKPAKRQQKLYAPEPLPFPCPNYAKALRRHSLSMFSNFMHRRYYHADRMAFPVCPAPSILSEVTHTAYQAPIEIDGSIINKCLIKKHGKDLNVSILMKITDAIRHPMAIVQDGDPDNIVIITDMYDKNHFPLIVPLVLDQPGKTQGSLVHKIKSVYGRERRIGGKEIINKQGEREIVGGIRLPNYAWVTEHLARGHVLFLDKKRTHHWLQQNNCAETHFGLQVMRSFDLSSIIDDEPSFVKHPSDVPAAMKHLRKYWFRDDARARGNYLKIKHFKIREGKPVPLWGRYCLAMQEELSSKHKPSYQELLHAEQRVLKRMASIIPAHAIRDLLVRNSPCCHDIVMQKRLFLQTKVEKQSARP